MPISSLVVTVANSGSRTPESVVRGFAGEPGLEFGEPAGPRIPVVIDVEDAAQERRLLDALSAHPAVVHVDVVFVEVAADREP